MQESSSELEMARKVQEGLLATATPQLTGLRIEKKCVAAHRVGGDFFAFVERNEPLVQHSPIPGVVQFVDKRDHFLHAIIGDVAGHGVASALVMALCCGIFNEIAQHHRSPDALLTHMNTTLLSYIENSVISYVTACCITYFPHSKRLLWSKGGHPDPLLLRNNAIIPLTSSDPFLGMFPNEIFSQSEIQLETNDRLLLVTDGLCEARNGNAFFGEENLCHAFLSTTNLPANQVISVILDKIATFSDHQQAIDDQTLVLLEIT